MTTPILHSVNPATGDIDFKIFMVNEACVHAPVINKFQVLLWIEEGTGRLMYEMQEYEFTGPCLILAPPFRPFAFVEPPFIKATAVQFTNEFYWFQRNNPLDDCSGTLYSRECGLPIVTLEEQDIVPIQSLFTGIYKEFEVYTPPDREMLFAYLKALLIHTLRIINLKHQEPQPYSNGFHADYAVLRNLMHLINDNFRTLKRPSDYADLLHITTGALTKTARKYYGKTVSSLIQERVLEEARRELALTELSIKEIAAALGYDDPYYFSRLFKKLSGIPPETYRNNLSWIPHNTPQEMS